MYLLPSHACMTNKTVTRIDAQIRLARPALITGPCLDGHFVGQPPVVPLSFWEQHHYCSRPSHCKTNTSYLIKETDRYMQFLSFMITCIYIYYSCNQLHHSVYSGWVEWGMVEYYYCKTQGLQCQLLVYTTLLEHLPSTCNNIFQWYFYCRISIPLFSSPPPQVPSSFFLLSGYLSYLSRYGGSCPPSKLFICPNTSWHISNISWL